jgi:hypothetical protein
LPASRRFSLEQPRATRIDARKGLELFQLSDHLPLAKEVLQEVHARPHDELYTSALTVGEILIKPVEAGDEALVRRYESALLQGAVTLPLTSNRPGFTQPFERIAPSVPWTRSSSLARRMRAWISLSLMMSGSARNQFLESSSSAHCSAHSCDCGRWDLSRQIN